MVMTGCQREGRTHGIHRSSTNFATISRVLFAFSLTLFSALRDVSERDSVVKVRGVSVR